MKAELTPFETFWYYLAVIGSFGGVFTLKVIIKKATAESNRIVH